MQIQDIINDNVNGATFVSIDTTTEPRLKGGKSNPHKGRVTKVMTGANVMVFQNKSVNGYDAMVKRRLEKEGKNPDDFQLGPRAWGERIPNTPFVEHKGQLYLEVIFLKSGEVHYELDGVEVDAAEIQGLEYTSNNGHQGGLDDKVIIRTFKVDNINRVTINKEVYDL